MWLMGFLPSLTALLTWALFFAEGGCSKLNQTQNSLDFNNDMKQQC